MTAAATGGESARSRSPAIRYPTIAEHGRGLKIIDAVADNLQLTGNESQGTIVHFEKTLEWLPGAAGQHLISTDNAAGHADRGSSQVP